MAREVKNFMIAVLAILVLYLYLNSINASGEAVAKPAQKPLATFEPMITQGSSYEADTHIVKLVNLNKDGAVILNVDGKRAIIRGKNPVRVGKLSISVIETFYSDAAEDRAATLAIAVYA
ncbi:MAG: hypothetical protein HY438_03320 [DPANN group archaeon]|nr:hypothetical protein [DPANN group archaeon]